VYVKAVLNLLFHLALGFALCRCSALVAACYLDRSFHYDPDCGRDQYALAAACYLDRSFHYGHDCGFGPNEATYFPLGFLPENQKQALLP
jgi:hypothetical protein